MELYFNKYPELADLLVRFTDPTNADFDQWDLMTDEEALFVNAQMLDGTVYQSLEDFIQTETGNAGIKGIVDADQLNAMIDQGLLVVVE
jgi:hypothetical protein